MAHLYFLLILASCRKPVSAYDAQVLSGLSAEGKWKLPILQALRSAQEKDGFEDQLCVLCQDTLVLTLCRGREARWIWQGLARQCFDFASLYCSWSIEGAHSQELKARSTDEADVV